MALTVQLGIHSLLSAGLGYGDVAALVQDGRRVGSFSFAQQNDTELFESLSEVYGIILRRRGLIDPTVINSLWSGNMNLICNGRVLPESMHKDLKHEIHGSFTWLMVVLVSGLDFCLSSSQLLELLIDVFIAALQRDDPQNVRESLEALISTNIRSWRSTGCFLGMAAPLTAAIRDARVAIVGHGTIPLLTRTERTEL